MALNIPLPSAPGEMLLKGVQTGGNLFSQIMNPIIEREKQKQLAEQFQQELALKKQMEARLGANSGINREILQQQLLALKHKNDPNWEMDQFNKLFGGTSGTQSSHNAQNTQDLYPDLNKMFSGQGVFPSGEIEEPVLFIL